MRKKILIIGATATIVIGLLTGSILELTSSAMPSRPGGGFIAQLQQSFSSARNKSSTEAGMPLEFAFHRLEIDTSKPQAEACLVFTRKLDVSGHTHYQDYIALSPDTQIVARAFDDRLCLAGLNFNTSYQLTLKPGFPSAGGDTIPVAEIVPVELRDKPALVRFAGGVVLPRDNADGVPVMTVNVDALKLKLIRVGDRLLSQIETGLVDRNSLYGWDEDQLEKNQGHVIWTGTMKVDAVKNASVTTLIPIAQMLKDRAPGAYVLVAQDAAKRKQNADGSDDDGDLSGEMAVQWVIDSDIALTTFNAGTGAGAGGMAVFARSYANALPKRSVKLTLISRDNTVLGTAMTDNVGRADFDAGLMRGIGGAEPVAVMAYGSDGDFSFLDLRRPSFDLTDRGVGGRAPAGPVDGYLYTERGVYRPGETVHAVAMLRDRLGAAVSAPLTLVEQRPDGVEVARVTVPADALKAGTAQWDPALNPRSPHGRWQIAAYVDPKADPVGRVQFDVQDFVPQRLKVNLVAQSTLLAPKAPILIHADARFLYGAPGTGLGGDGEARIMSDSKPFPAYAQYQFGRMDDTFADVVVPLTVPDTDAAGVATVTGSVGDIADTTLALKAHVRVSIHEPGGRTTDKTVDIRVATHAIAIGMRPDFDDGAVPENAPAKFEIIALDQNGNRIARAGLTYSWVREDTSYQWYQDNGQWKYQATTRDRLIAGGKFDVAAATPARLMQAMPWGTYRLTITDAASGAASSYRFYSGWAANAAGDRPDRIPVAADKPSYKAGDIARVTFKPDADGQALVVVAGEKVFSSQVVSAPAGTASVDIPVSPDWGAGAYVLITAYRPLNKASAREPVRSIGLTWLTVDNSERTLSPQIGAAKTVRPRQKLIVPVTVKGLSSGETAYLTLAAVDEGILQLTDFKTPDPAGYYYGKRRLGTGMRDDYGRLIRADKGPVGSLREGGDSLGGRTLAVVPQRTVALYSGVVAVNGNGVANIPLDIPDFNGELRLMAVAYSANKTGSSDKALTVRDPVIADLILPRFLASGDRAAAALTLDNVEGAPGNYTATVTVSGPLGLDSGATQNVVQRVLKKGERALIPVVLNGRGAGIATVTLRVSGPKGFAVTRSWPIELRSPQLDVSRDDLAALAPGQSYTANAALLANMIPGTAAVTVNLSATRAFGDVPGLMRWLDYYPYDCIEQTSSKAMPYLYFNNGGQPAGRALSQHVQDAVGNVVDMQNPAGNFGMWGPGSDAEPWASVFALDFLEQAKAAGYAVPDQPLAHGVKWLQQTASGSGNDAVRAYAFYVLARAGQENLSDLRYFSDTRGPHWKTAIAGALTGAAAASAGDRSRAAYGFDRAREIALSANPAAYPDDNYGSYARDLAAVIALAVPAGEGEILPALLQKSSLADLRLNTTTTQDKAWMLRAAYELSKQRVPLNLLIDGRPVQPSLGAVHLSPAPAQLAHGITIVNRGSGAVWRDVSVVGTPALPLPPVASGLTLTKNIYTMAGAPADLNALKQNDRVIVVLAGTMADNFHRRMAVTDLLASGLEIETALAGDDAKPYAFLGELTAPQVQEARDDRFVAAFDIGSRYRGVPSKEALIQPTFRLAYIARAVTAGNFLLPAAAAEDMYAPGIMARTAMAKVNINPAK